MAVPVKEDGGVRERGGGILRLIIKFCETAPINTTESVNAGKRTATPDMWIETWYRHACASLLYMRYPMCMCDVFEYSNG